MELNEKRMEVPEFGSSPGFEPTPQNCRVVYIHPENRFYTVEFRSLRGETFRQSYFPRWKRGNPDAPKKIGAEQTTAHHKKKR